jgi:hypothetical protein
MPSHYIFLYKGQRVSKSLFKFYILLAAQLLAHVYVLFGAVVTQVQISLHQLLVC